MDIFRLVLWSIFLWTACQNSEFKQTISDEKMVKIVVDLYSIEAILQSADAKQRDSLTAIYQAQVFDYQEVTQIDYERNIEILSQTPSKLDSIFVRANRFLTSTKGQQK